MAGSSTTLENALLDSEPIMNGAGALLEHGGLRRVARGADTLMDIAAINAVLPDDAAARAARKAQRHLSGEISYGGPRALLEVLNDKYKQKGRLSFTGGEEAEPGASGQREKKEPPPSALDQGVALADKGLQYGGYALMGIDLAPMVLGRVATLVGLPGINHALHGPQRWMEKTEVFKNVNGRQALSDGLQLGFSAIQSYGVAKGFAENMESLKEMYRDVTGKPAPSTVEMFTAEMPPVMVDARSHFVKEYGIRGAVQITGWGMMVRDLMTGHLKAPDKIEGGRIGFTSGFLPGMADMGIAMLMGTAVTEVYKGFKKAHESGQPLGANEYAAFILACNTDLNKHRVAKQVAMEVGALYAAEKASPGEIMRQMNNGRFMERIKEMVVKDEAESAQRHAAMTAANGGAAVPPQQAAAKTSLPAPNGTPATEDKSSPDRPVYGKFTHDYQASQAKKNNIMAESQKGTLSFIK